MGSSLHHYRKLRFLLDYGLTFAWPWPVYSSWATPLLRLTPQSPNLVVYWQFCIPALIFPIVIVSELVT